MTVLIGYVCTEAVSVKKKLRCIFAHSSARCCILFTPQSWFWSTTWGCLRAVTPTSTRTWYLKLLAHAFHLIPQRSFFYKLVELSKNYIRSTGLETRRQKVTDVCSRFPWGLIFDIAHLQRTSTRMCRAIALLIMLCNSFRWSPRRRS